MKLLIALVLAAATPAVAAPAAGGAPAGGDAGGLQDFLANPLLFVGVMVVLMYFLLLRPQQQRAKQHQNSVNGIKRGDSVVLSSGVIGKVVRVEDKELGIELAQNVTVKVIKSMVAEVRTKGEPAPANDSKK